MKKVLSFKTNDGGQSLVEFALVLPILMVLILGMIEFGWILNGKITLTSAAREGARAAITFENEEDAKDAVESAVSKSSESSSLIGITTDTTFEEKTENGRTIKNAIVNVNAQINPIVGLFFSDAVDLKAKAEMRVE